MTTILAALVSALLFLAAATLKATGFHPLGAGPMAAAPEWALALAVGLLYYALTLAGIVAGILFESLEGLDENTPVKWARVRGFLTTGRAWKGLLVSPLIFLTVYLGVRSSPLSAPFVLLAFQNGFFWKSALSKLKPQ